MRWQHLLSVVAIAGLLCAPGGCGSSGGNARAGSRARARTLASAKPAPAKPAPKLSPRRQAAQQKKQLNDLGKFINDTTSALGLTNGGKTATQTANDLVKSHMPR